LENRCLVSNYVPVSCWMLRAACRPSRLRPPALRPELGRPCHHRTHGHGCSQPPTCAAASSCKALASASPPAGSRPRNVASALVAVVATASIGIMLSISNGISSAVREHQMRLRACLPMCAHGRTPRGASASTTRGLWWSPPRPGSRRSSRRSSRNVCP